MLFSLFLWETVSSIRPPILPGGYRLVGVSSFLLRSTTMHWVGLSNATGGFSPFSRSFQGDFALFDRKL